MYELDDDLPHGNAIQLSSGMEDGVWTIRFTPSAKGGAERLWFAARIRNRGGPARVPLRLMLCEADNLLWGRPDDDHPQQPVWRSDGGDWRRLSPGTPIVHDDGRTDVAWVVDAPVSVAECAVCMPFGEAQWRQTLAAAPDYWQESRVGTSCGDRALLRARNPVTGVDDRPGVFCTARNHSGEAPGSWVLDGFMRRWAERQVDDVALWVVPFVDRDGVDTGAYGKDHWPRDFNRAWTEVQSYRHEVAQIQADAKRWAQRCRPMLHLDWHAPGMVDVSPHVHDHARDAEPLSEAMAAAYGTAYEGFRRNAGYAGQLFEELGMNSAPNCTNWFRKHFGIRAVTMETPYMVIGTQPVLVADYHAIGARLADACLEWVKGAAAEGSCADMKTSAAGT